MIPVHSGKRSSSWKSAALEELEDVFGGGLKALDGGGGAERCLAHPGPSRASKKEMFGGLLLLVAMGAGGRVDFSMFVFGGGQATEAAQAELPEGDAFGPGEIEGGDWEVFAGGGSSVEVSGEGVGEVVGGGRLFDAGVEGGLDGAGGGGDVVLGEGDGLAGGSVGFLVPGDACVAWNPDGVDLVAGAGEGGEELGDGEGGSVVDLVPATGEAGPETLAIEE